MCFSFWTFVVLPFRASGLSVCGVGACVGRGLRFLHFACERPTMSASCIYWFFSPQPLDTRCIPTFARPLPSSLLFPLICICLCSKVILISYCNGSGRCGISLFPKLVLVFFFFKLFFDCAAKHVGSLFPDRGLNLRPLH